MASTSKEDRFSEIIGQAQVNAEFMSKMSSAPYRNLEVGSFQCHREAKGQTGEMDQNQVLEFCQSLSAYIADEYSDLKSHEVYSVFLNIEKQLLTSSKAFANHQLPRTIIVIGFFYESDGEVVSLRDFISFPQKPNANIYELNYIKERINGLYKKVREKSEGVFPEAGVKDVVLGPAVTGVLVHEAIGHPSEADLVDAGAVTRNLVDQRVCSELVSMVDFAHSYDGNELPVPVYIDDEGTEAKDITIIDRGIYKGFMNNKEAAAKWNMPLTGNARAFGYDDEPLIRMRNTVLLPGKDKFEDIIASIEDGYYLTDRSNGQADLTSEFMFGVTFGYEIKNGKLGRALKDSTISGVAFDMLKSISKVSDEFEVHSIGMCGKKQPMMVSHGGPSIKCKVHIGGH